MPNWADNRIIVSGDSEKIKKFLNDGVKNSAGNYHFGSWIPIPETYVKYDTTNHPYGKGLVVGEKDCFSGIVTTEERLKEFIEATKYQKKTYGVIGWYDWNVNNYGCKWDEDMELLERIDDNEKTECITFLTTTPWSSPIEFVRTIVQRYKFRITMYSHFEDCVNQALIFEADDNGELSETDITDTVKDRINSDAVKFLSRIQDERTKELLLIKWNEYTRADYVDISRYNIDEVGNYDLSIFIEDFKEWVKWCNESDDEMLNNELDEIIDNLWII